MDVTITVIKLIFFPGRKDVRLFGPGLIKNYSPLFSYLPFLFSLLNLFYSERVFRLHFYDSLQFYDIPRHPRFRARYLHTYSPLTILSFVSAKKCRAGRAFYPFPNPRPPTAPASMNYCKSF